ncbi:methionine--tRNA ligase [Cytophagales bacterium LB-30]|uniref:Methionine--tRNA ligase n=1 Tax=Shiella aurantiaca TaxID=3058365 RepID=A0ABT8F7P7_9BACT|nr:methionine--tRNA ligase [Shiella aurantiaca]MDN4166259.1 methionine--tRNA ligase [Shiella aurantiaca]
MSTKKFNRYTITAALPYANGPLHIGHIAGAYLPSDIYVRYLRLKGEDVVYICGSDEHGVAITIGAKKEGVTPREFIEKYHQLMKGAFEEFGISFDIYSRTSTPTHYAMAQDFFKKIHADGGLIEETSDQYFDEKEQLFLADRYIIGTCPVCANENAYGDQCEKCGTSLSPKQLINPRSTVSGAVPVLKPTKHWYFPLDRYEGWLKEWLLEGHKADLKSNVFGQCKSWLDQGLQPRSITRDLDWGIPVPIAGGEGKVLYVWFDAPIGYISATKELKPNDWEKYWKSDDTRLIHFIGKDNIVFHCIIFPSMLKAAGDFILPDNVPANEFLNLEGDKISTSRNHAVWLHEYLKELPNRKDELRYVLTSIAPETKDADFTWKDYQQRVNSELVAILGNFVNRVMVLTWKYFDGKVPAEHELPNTNEVRARILEKYNTTHEELDKSVAEMTKCLNDFRFREGQFHMMNLARLGNKFLADTEPWKLAKDDMEAVGCILNYALTVVGNIAIACEPFLPHTAASLKQQLNAAASGIDWSEFWKKNQLIRVLAPGHQLGKAELLFRNVEDEEVDIQIDKLRKTKETNQAKKMSETTPAPQENAIKEAIQFDDFAKLDLRVGKITAAEKVEKADKLLKLSVDLGFEQRTIVSGIAEHFTPEEVVNKLVTIVANLAPRKLRGIESQGMILMAENAEGKLQFVNPGSDFELGAIVR